MKNIFKSICLISVLFFAIACEKDEVKYVYEGGKAPVLTASATSLKMVPADTARTVLTLNWTNPLHIVSNKTSSHNVTSIVEIDSTGKNFSKPVRLTFTNVYTTALNGKTLNKVLSDLNMIDTSKSYALQIRVITSLYHKSTELISAVLPLSASPFSLEPTALYPVPNNLFIVGDATEGGWNNPVPVPKQAFTKLDKFTFGGVFKLVGGKKFLFLPTNGDWGKKYALKSAGEFQPDNGADFTGPATDGLYKIIVNFVTGKYTVTAATAADAAPANLFIVGDATAGGWNNPVPVPSQQFTQSSNAGFELTLPLVNGKAYLLLPVNGSWNNKYAIRDRTAAGVKSGGTFLVDTGQDFIAPDEAGTYTISVEFINRTYKVVKK